MVTAAAAFDLVSWYMWTTSASLRFLGKWAGVGAKAGRPMFCAVAPLIGVNLSSGREVLNSTAAAERAAISSQAIRRMDCRRRSAATGESGFLEGARDIFLDGVEAFGAQPEIGDGGIEHRS